MTTIEAPPQVCQRCHGSGFEPVKRRPAMPKHTEAQLEILERLMDAGRRRGALHRKRSVAALNELQAIYQDIIVLNAEARRLGVTDTAIAEAVGVSRKGLWQITTGQRGG